MPPSTSSTRASAARRSTSRAPTRPAIAAACTSPSTTFPIPKRRSSVKDRVTLITGASKGIGAELARQLAAKGAKLVLAARNGTELDEVAAQCKALGASVITVKADVAVEHHCPAIVTQGLLAVRPIDVLVHN